MHSPSNITTQPRRSWAICVALFLVALAGCADDGPPGQQVIIGAGSDAADITDITRDAGGDDGVFVDPRCRDVDEGGACDLANAAGICVEGTCRFLTCRSGFRDCDNQLDNGCEADITTEARCGACDTACGDTASCQQSRFGYVCSTTPTCVPDRIDLDGDIANGCEYLVADQATTLARPSDIEIRAGDFADGVFWYAGQTSEGPVVGSTSTDSAPSTVVAAGDAGAAVGLVASPDDHLLTGVWREGVTLSAPPQSSVQDVFARYICEDGVRQLTGIDPVSGALVSAADSIFELADAARCGGAGRCLLRVFDQADYLRAFYPYATSSPPDGAAPQRYRFDQDDLTGCDTCFLDSDTGELTVDRACLGGAVCAQESASGNCSGCSPDLGSCPSFGPIGVYADHAGALAIVPTERGVTVLDTTTRPWSGVARVEDIGGAVEFIDASVATDPDGATVFLLGDDRRMYVVEVDPDADAILKVERTPVRIGIPIELDTATLLASDRDTVLVGSSRGASLVRARASGHVQEFIEAPQSAVDDPALVAVGYDGSAEQFGVLYSAIGQLIVRTVTRAPTDAGASQ